MIAASLKDAAGDAIIELLLRKGADVSMKSNTGQVSFYNQILNGEIEADKLTECPAFRKLKV
jgi:hypothetical protein